MKKYHGYVLLSLMLIIGSLGLYWSYQLSLTKMNTQSWQLTKTATEFSYWFDIEQNYEQDYAITNWIALNNIQLSTLIQNHYLPYGMARTPTFPSRNTPAVSSVSEFQCSPLPGITSADGNLSDSGLTDYTCPNQTAGSIAQCTLNEPAYYSCTTNSAISQAQYYINANHIALAGGPDVSGETSVSNAPIALGLIVRTPGFSKSVIYLGTGSSKGLLPNGSYAQSLITMLPSSSFNPYSTDSAEVKGIGIGSYLSINNIINPGTLVANDRYSKIIDMGLVQSVDLKSSARKCWGWDNNGNKLGTNISYTGSNNKDMSNTGTFPPTCIRIDMSKYGPGGSEKCARLDLFYTIYRNYLNTDPSSSRFFSSADSIITNSTAVNNYLDIYVGQAIQTVTTVSPYTYTYPANGAVPITANTAEQYNWLAYFLRCTRANT